MTLVEVRDVSRRYGSGRGRVDALRDVSFDVAPAERIAVTGPSGSGKSTLLHILGLVDRPTDGEVRFAGRGTRDLAEDERTRMRLADVGLVFQHFVLHPTLDAADNVALPAMEAGIPADAARDRARGLLDGVGLSARVDHRPGELSGGEQQRVAIARALVNEPRLVLADEPTGELDTDTEAKVLDLLDTLAAEHGFSLVLATHDEDLAARIGRVLHLEDGRVVRDAGREEG